MKKLLYCAAALATLLFAGSCQREDLEPAQESAAVTFTVEAPAALQTKAIADGLNVNQLIYEVWLTDELGVLTSGAQKLYQAETTMAEENGVNKATLTLDLVNDQKFTVLFWAQVKEAGAYDTDELTEVTYAKSEYNANDESLAAFYAVAYVNDCKHVEKDGTTAADSKVSLRRPFAQLNLGTLNTSTAYTVTMVSSEVKVTSANTVFNVATSAATVPAELTFKNAAVPTDPATLTVNGTTYEYAAMNYLFAGDNATVEYDIVTKLNAGMDGKVNNIVNAVPLKENYRTNIIGNLLTSKTDYEIVVDAEFTGDINRDGQTTYVTNDDELKAALSSEKGDIIIDLAQKVVSKASTEPTTYNVDVTSGTTLAFGGANTRSITINANDNTINFNLKDSDWSHVSLNNDAAVLTINDATLKTSGYNTSHWKRIILHFASNVVLNNVKALNGLGFKKDASLSDVEVSQVGDNYALWAWAQGQTVTLDGVSVDSPGRALKIADEDVDGPSKVTINVANSSFKSAKKAAILVSSTAGAVINWEKGNSIADVTADPINAVWVDEDWAQYASEVQVNGATVAVEGNVEVNLIDTTEELVAALKNGESYILLEPGNYALANPAIAAANVIVQGKDRENCVIKITKQLRADGKSLTFKNLTIDVPTGLAYDEHNFAWIHYFKEFNMIDCNSNGRIRLNSHKANIEGCTFAVTTSSGFDGYALHYQGADKSTVNVKSCTFNTAGKAIVMYNEGKPVFDLNVEDCTFTSSDASTDKAAIQMHTEYGISGTLDIAECTSTGFADVNGGLWNELNNNTKVPTYNFTITVDGATVQEAGYEKVSDGVYKKGVNYNVSNAAGLAYMNTIFANKSAGRDVVLKLTSDIDFSGYTWTPVDSHADSAFEIAEINGNGHTISNFTVNGQAMFKRFAGSGDVVIKDITFDNATVNSTAINTSILTVQTYQNVLLDNVDVKNSTITGGYKVAPLLATVYNESSSTVTATLKNCDVENVTVKATSYDFCTAGMVAFVYADNNDKVVFENCTVKDVKLIAPDDGYKAHAAVYTTGSDSLYNEAEGVTVTNVTFEAL